MRGPGRRPPLCNACMSAVLPLLLQLSHRLLKVLSLQHSVDMLPVVAACAALLPNRLLPRPMHRDARCKARHGHGARDWLRLQPQIQRNAVAVGDGGREATAFLHVVPRPVSSRQSSGLSCAPPPFLSYPNTAWPCTWTACTGSTATPTCLRAHVVSRWVLCRALGSHWSVVSAASPLADQTCTPGLAGSACSCCLSVASA